MKVNKSACKAIGRRKKPEQIVLLFLQVFAAVYLETSNYLPGIYGR